MGGEEEREVEGLENAAVSGGTGGEGGGGLC